MKIKNLHSWDVTYREAINIQQTLREKLILDDKNMPDEIRTIAGADISYSRGSNLFFAAVVLLEFPSLEIIEETFFTERVIFPYIPGLLTFREGLPLLKAFEKLRIVPDVAIFDGQGIAHPRGLGLASHMGLFLNMPTIGCAKTRLAGKYDEPGKEVGDYSPLMLDDRIVGAVLRTKKNVKPVFISQGHKIGLQRAIDIVLSSCTGYKLPEPVRKAHLTVNRIRMGHGGKP
ncbi:MAG: deoxyribonuclease V [Thermodesulfobacteriota bacterium]|nr:deoxyribonuclease V [Thermodesulfobacteriota bacterium]